ncbi:hypothetical protein CPB83DRAFT_903545 [Crepidotus variabilis]|uniref:NACHT domain-containing protein n=1 Tax=Crepidotus variabilis TaxID=179855 RepID=A0A9P6JUJ3_9AGAR|nr:hypothetical protein CPB83DRAFT_903545 [Crepidotus variabilis]
MSVQMFAHAQKVRIEGSHFSTTVINKIKGLDRFLDYCSPASLLDSRDRFDPPRCAPETRSAVLHELRQWFTEPECAALLMWLYGGPGVGKTALGQTFAEERMQLGLLLATFFFCNTAPSVDRSDGDRLIPTILVQILHHLPSLQPYVEQALSTEVAIFQRSRRTQMEKLIIEPIFELVKREEPPTDPLLIVVDGLDECSSAKTQSDLIHILTDALPRIPYPLRILIASRPESHIVDTFNHKIDKDITSKHVRRLDLDAVRGVNDDIWRVFRKAFDDIHKTHPIRWDLQADWPSHQEVQSLVWRASGNFTYVSTVIGYLQDPNACPDEQLNIILGLQVTPPDEKPFAQLDTLYSHIFSVVNKAVLPNVLLLLSVLHVMSRVVEGPTSVSSDASIQNLARIMGLRPAKLVLLLQPLRSLISIPDQGEGHIRPPHKSLYDFLLDPQRSGEYFLDTALGGERLFLHYRSNLETLGKSGYTDFWTGSHWGTLGSEAQNIGLIMLHYGLHTSPSTNTLAKGFQDRSQIFIIRISKFIDVLFTLLSREDFESSKEWQIFHAKKIRDALEAAGRLCNPKMSSEWLTRGEPVFLDPVTQNVHLMYKALLMVQNDIHTPTSPHAARSTPDYGKLYEFFREDDHQFLRDTFYRNQGHVGKHLGVVLLPYMSVSTVGRMGDYGSNYRSADVNFLSPNDELDVVACQRLVAFMKRHERYTRPETFTWVLDNWGIDKHFRWRRPELQKAQEKLAIERLELFYETP